MLIVRTMRLIAQLFFATITISSAFGMTPAVGEKNINWDEREKLDLTKSIKPFVNASIETKAVPREVNEDAADDPAIWLHPKNPNLSKVYGTDKRGGLVTYDLSGNELQYLDLGSINNVDVRYGFKFNGKTCDIAAATNRTTRTIDVFQINHKNGFLSLIHSIPVTDAIDDLYGFCLGKSKNTKRFFAYVNGKNGKIEQYELSDKNGLHAELFRTLEVPSKPEGMVCDDKQGFLYVGEEENGIWKFSSEDLLNSSGELILSTIISKNDNIQADIEGICIFHVNENEGYLIASSQGNHSYVVFDKNADYRYLGSFSITDAEKIDGVEETDGIEVINCSLGEMFPAGVFIAQDGYNFTENGQPQSQNFKLVDWESIANSLQLKTSPDFISWLK